MSDDPRFVHDTKRIIAANTAALQLFRCEEWEVIDRELLEFVPAMAHAPTKLNLYLTRKGQGTNVRPKVYRFMRCDGTLFEAEVTSRKCDDGTIETTVIYRGEVAVDE